MIKLFTDLDGTFIPEDRESEEALLYFKKELKNKNLVLIYVTGRNLKETKQAIKDYKLPSPSYIICDVGSTIYKKRIFNFVHLKAYWTLLENKVDQFNYDKIKTLLSIEQDLELQENSKQNKFKLSYYFKAELEDQIINKVTKKIKNTPWEAITSLDNKNGLLDLLPKGVNKLFAIKWLLSQLSVESNNVIFSGDSGNDLQVFNSDISSIVVGNAPDKIKNMVRDRKNIYISNKNFTSGVLDGYMLKYSHESKRITCIQRKKQNIRGYRK